MGRDKWTITWFTHVNTLQVCTVQKNGESDIYPDYYPRTELYSEPFLRSFIYLYFISSYGHFPFNDSERVFICMYFYLLHAYCDFIVLMSFMIYE